MTTITSTEAGATGRYINLGSSAVLDGLGAQTIIAYCNPTSAAPAVTGYLFSKCDSAGAGRRLSIAATTGAIGYAANSSGTPGAPAKVTTAAVTAGVWQHIQVTWAGALAASDINIYKDASATLAATQADSGTGSITSDAAYDAWLMNRTGLGREFVGDLAYVAQWNRVLSDAERTTVRTDGPLAVPSGLVLCWANDQDYSTNAITATARSTRVTGSAPTNTAMGDAADTTAPTLTSPTGTQTGSTTATVGATTDEANGTLYAVVTTSATAPSVAQIQAGQDNASAAAAWAGNVAVSSIGAKTFGATGLTASTAYYAHIQHKDAALNNSTVVTSASFTTAASDTTVPTQIGTVTVGTVTATSIQITWPAGADNTAVASYETSPDGTTWTDRGNVLTYTFTGLTASTSYTFHVRAKDAAGNVSTPALQVTQATSAAVVTKGARLTLYNGATLQASLTGIRVLWWDVIDPSGAPTYSTAVATTNASGVLTLDLNAATALAVGAYGFLLLYKVNTTRNDSLVFAGQVIVSDIA